MKIYFIFFIDYFESALRNAYILSKYIVEIVHWVLWKESLVLLPKQTF